jgi:hypothetical protein
MELCKSKMIIPSLGSTIFCSGDILQITSTSLAIKPFSRENTIVSDKLASQCKLSPTSRYLQKRQSEKTASGG